MNRSFGGSFDCNSINYNKGKSFRFGEWNSSTLYSNDDYIQDFVSYMGSMYACIQTNIATEPTNEIYWKLVVSGQQGAQGKQGNTGVTFTPHVDTDGNLSWTNDGGLENPQTVNIKGPKGADSTVPGPKGDKGETGVGLQGPQGRTGEMGIGLDFNWDGTKLGIKRTVDDEYTYVDLKGTTGSRGLKGNTGNPGPQGPQGPKGDSLNIRVSAPDENGKLHLEKRYNDTEDWEKFFDLSLMQGSKGDSIIVEKDSEENIYYRYESEPSSANRPLIDKEKIRGPRGPKGDTIAKTYVADDGYLYIQLSGEDLPRRVGYVRGDRGADGREIVLRVYSGPSEDPNDPRIGTHLQWKYAGDEYKLWSNLIQINDLMNYALAGIRLENKQFTETDEEGNQDKFEKIMLNSYRVEFDDSGKLIVTDKIASISSITIPTGVSYNEFQTEINNEKTNRENADSQLQINIDNLEALHNEDIENIQNSYVQTSKLKTINGESLLITGEDTNIEISGGSDITSYNDLTDKPSINNVELTGNKTSTDLGLQPAGDYALSSDIPSLEGYATQTWINEQKFLTSVPDEYITNTELESAISEVSYTLPIATTDALGGIKVGAGLFINPDTGVLSATGGGVADSVDWNNVISQPRINGHNLVSGDNSLASLGIQPAGDYALSSQIPTIPTNVSEFTNDAGYITDSALTNYALKSEIPDTSNFVTSNTIETALTGHLKTINGQSLIGSGNITIESGGADTGITDVPNDDKTYARSYGTWIDITNWINWLTWGEYD